MTDQFVVSYGPKMAVTHSGAFGAGRPSQYPWDKLTLPQPDPDNAGEVLYAQFFVPGKTTKSFSGAAQAAGKRLNATYTVRSAQMDGVEGVLVQRVEYRAPRVLDPAVKAARAAKAAATRAKNLAAK